MTPGLMMMSEMKMMMILRPLVAGLRVWPRESLLTSAPTLTRGNSRVPRNQGLLNKHDFTESDFFYSRKKRKASIDESQELADKYYSDCLKSRSSIKVEERLECYNTIMKQLEEEVTRIQENVFSEVFDNIVSFVRESRRSVKSDTIPTAALLTGVNMPDHNKVFDQLIDKLSVISSHVAILGPGLNIKSLVQQIVMELTEEEEKTIIKKTDASFSALEKWFSEKYSGDGDQPPLIVILQDFEASAGPALTDLILLMKRYSSLPFVLIFGVATTITTVHSTLPHSATSKLTINTFGSPPATRLLDNVIDNIIINADNPFKLSHKVFQFLIENFLFHDFAVEHFLQGYKFIIGEHFYRVPASFLCTDLKTALIKLKSVRGEELDSVRRLPSFRSYVENCEGDSGVKLLVDKTECVKTVSRMLEEFHANTALFTVLVKCLHHLVCDLPRRPLGKVLRDVYEYAVKGGVTNSQQYKEAWQFLKLVSRYDLEEKTRQSLDELKKVKDDRLKPLVTCLEECLKKLENLVEEDSSCVSSPAPAVMSLSSALSAASRDQSPAILPSSLPALSNSALTTPLTSATSSPQISSKNNPGKLDRFKLKEALLQSMKEKNRSTPVRPYDIIRTDLLSAFNTAFTDLLVSPDKMTLHEIFLFSSPAAVRRHLVGAPRAALHTALTDPWEYLDHADLKVQDTGEILPTFPDICIGYKLHLECQKLINLYDWLMCWNTISTGGDEDKEVPDQVQQAKFARVVQELQHLGFIRTSTRKTDHVARLTFGGS